MFTTYGCNGAYYVYDSTNNHTAPSSILGKLNLFNTKILAQIEANRLNKQLTDIKTEEID